MKFVKRSTATFGAALATFVLAGTSAAQGITFPHIHGLAYSADGKQLFGRSTTGW